MKKYVPLDKRKNRKTSHKSNEQGNIQKRNAGMGLVPFPQVPEKFFKK